MHAFTALLTLSFWGVINLPGCADAQTGAAGPQTGVSKEPPAGAREATRDIIVTARRDSEPRVAVENEFDEDEIAARGADSIQNLLTRLAPFIGEDAPIILINGRPAGFDRSILSYPAEALSRLAVLKPEAAAAYGAAFGKRVVNLVLKPKFSASTAEAGANWATGGGQFGTALSTGRTAVSGDTRWSVQLRFAHDGALLKSARRVPAPAGLFDNVGFVSGLDGGEIDPALSNAVGEAITVAAIAPQARSGVPALDDFVGTANQNHPVDANAFDSFQPSRRALSFNADVTRPLGRFFVTLSVSADNNRARGLRGLPMVSIVLPSSSPWSPFNEDVVLIRPFSGERALHNDNDSTLLRGALTLAGAINGWQTSFSLSYQRNWTGNLLETGVDLPAVDRLVSEGNPEFNPFGPWSDRLLLATRASARGDNLGARLNVQKKIADLPAGPLAWSFIADASRTTMSSQQSGNIGTLVARTNSLINQANGQTSLAMPLSRRDQPGIGWLGDVGVNLGVGGLAMSRTGAEPRFGAGLNWSPTRAAQFNVVYEYAGTAPSFDQLDAPIIRTVTRIFDYTRREVAEPVWITGGNPDLQRGSRQTLSIAAQVQPLRSQKLSINVTYRRTMAKGGNTGFPELSPAIEAAFPDRITRTASGHLAIVDARAINIAEDVDANLFSGLTLRFSRGEQRSPAPTGNLLEDPLLFTVSFNHTWHLKSAMMIRPGVPVIDRLGGGTGTSRHVLNAQIGAGKRAIGANLDLNWNSAARIDDGAGNDGLRVESATVLNFSTFVELDQLLQRTRASGAMKDLKVSLSIDNLFDNYRHVTFKDGTVPAGFSHDEIDPLGRTIRLTIRKRL